MRYWDPVRDPDRRQTRQRTAVRQQPPSTQFGQRPMFSRADEEQKPATSELASEARLDDLVPADEGPGSVARVAVINRDSLVPVFLTHSTDNVSATPTDAEVEAAFGNRSTGFVGFIIDSGGAGKAWICIKYRTYWHVVGMTRAT